MKRRPVSPFSLSFLDIMFCGFGAVVLLVLILDIDTVKARNAISSDLRADVMKLEQELFIGQEALAAVQEEIQATDQSLDVNAAEAKDILATLRALQNEITELKQETLDSKKNVNALTSELKSLDSERAMLGSRKRAPGAKVREFVGEGDRQYVTGLKMGGKHILILVDSSASMLDETIVNVIRRRNMVDAQKRIAPKWKRALATADWLISNLPATANFQLYTFNTQAKAALPSSEGKWLAASNRQEVDDTVNALARTVPANGTSLYHAFAVARSLAPKPDNILLITDGLPTQGRGSPSGATVSAKKRLKHFDGARKTLPSGIPVNTILLPMEGDAFAAAAFWKLALDTRGSFLTPARDWP